MATKKYLGEAGAKKLGECVENKIKSNYGNTALTNMQAVEATTNNKHVVGAGAIKELNDNLDGLTVIQDATGKITGYKTNRGADTVFPFSGDFNYEIITPIQPGALKILVTKEYKGIFAYFWAYRRSDTNPGSIYIRNIRCTVNGQETTPLVSHPLNSGTWNGGADASWVILNPPLDSTIEISAQIGGSGSNYGGTTSYFIGFT